MSAQVSEPQSSEPQHPQTIESTSSPMLPAGCKDGCYSFGYQNCMRNWVEMEAKALFF